MKKEELLYLLDRTEGYLSGGELSRRLGVTRAAVWKGMEALRQEGWVIESAPGRGYRLSAGPDRLRAGVLAGAGEQVGAVVECLDTVDSTNNVCKLRAAQGAPHGLVVTAEEQTGGRGRRGRSFQSPRGKGLYLSALLRPSVEPARAVGLTPWVAVAVCRAIEGLTGLRPAIKWTNDILLEGKKLCGILTEMEVEGETGLLRYVVTGIGINVYQTEEDFSPEVAALAASLAQHMETPPTRVALARALIGELDRMSREFPAEGAGYLAEYRARCMTPGHEVEVLTPAGSRRGFAREVDGDFRLVVAFEDGSVEALSSGEVSIRVPGAPGSPLD